MSDDLEDLLQRLRHEPGEADERRVYGIAYRELRQIAGRLMHGEPKDHTLRPTELVHEAYIKLVGNPGRYNSSAHFMAVAAQAMRHILVDYARRKATIKRGRDLQRVSLDGRTMSAQQPDIDMLSLDAALLDLAERDPRMARIAEMKTFAGMTAIQIAEFLGVSKRTVDRDWSVGRTWLAHAVSRG